MFTHPEIWSFASNWYRLLDIHAPIDSYKKLLTEDVELVFPEASLNGFSGYSQWYENVTNLFFDERHTLKVADINNIDKNECELHVVVNWHASVWKPPTSHSSRLKMDADQTWKVKKSSDGDLAVSKYVVNKLIYEEGSCKL